MTIDWLAADWPAPDGIVAGCTTRGGGVSDGAFTSLNLGAHVGDSIDQVRENRRRFALHCELPAEPLWLEQVHGTTVAVEPESGHPAVADAVLTRKADTVCAVMTADCLPVLFVSTSGDEIAATHAGWRGLCNGVLENTLREFRAPASNILAWLGPAISQNHFEVGDEVRQAFVGQENRATDHFVANDNGRWQADLYGLARLRLAKAGVQHTYGGDACTYGDTRRFFSYRRDGHCGRMASFVFRYA
jgi:YfiH family protein